MFPKMLNLIVFLCLLTVFFSVSNMFSTEAWEADKRCDKERDIRWDPFSCGGYGKTECATKSVEFKADPGPCIGVYPGWECDQNGPTTEYWVGTVQCYWKKAVHPKKSVCNGDETTLQAKDVPACRER